MKHHTWAEMFNRLRLYVDNQQGSNTFVDPVNDHDLMSWVKDQRRQYRNLKENAGEAQESSSASNRPPGSALDSSRIRALEQIGFTWDMRHDVEWKRRFEELCEYKERNGTCMVPARCKEYPKLGRWVMTQRRQYVLMGREGKESRMTRERLEMLNSIEFVWVVRNSKYNRVLGQQNNRFLSVSLTILPLSPRIYFYASFFSTPNQSGFRN